MAIRVKFLKFVNSNLSGLGTVINATSGIGSASLAEFISLKEEVTQLAAQVEASIASIGSSVGDSGDAASLANEYALQAKAYKDTAAQILLDVNASKALVETSKVAAQAAATTSSTNLVATNAAAALASASKDSAQAFSSDASTSAGLAASSALSATNSSTNAADTLATVNTKAATVNTALASVLATKLLIDGLLSDIEAALLDVEASTIQSASNALTAGTHANTASTKATQAAASATSANTSATNASADRILAQTAATSASASAATVNAKYTQIVDLVDDAESAEQSALAAAATSTSNLSSITTLSNTVSTKHAQVLSTTVTVESNKNIASTKAALASDFADQAELFAAEAASDQASVSVMTGVVSSNLATSLVYKQNTLDARDEVVALVSSISGGVKDMGHWSAAAGTLPTPPTVTTGGTTTTISAFWNVNVAGTVQGISYIVGDTLHYSAGISEFYKLEGSSAVRSVNGKTGTVTLNYADVGAINKVGTVVANQVPLFADSTGALKNSGFTIGKSIPSNALFTDTVYSHPQGDGYSHVPPTGIESSGFVLRAGTTANSAYWSPFDKASVGLSNVNNWAASNAINSPSTTTYATSAAVKAVADLIGTGSGGSGSWSSPITLSLSGDVTGAVSIDGSGNVTLNSVVANNSHTHTIANITSLQTTLDAKYSSTNTNIGAASFNYAAGNHNHNGSYLGISANAVSSTSWATPITLSLSGDATGSVSFDGSANAGLIVAVADNSHAHTIANVTGLQALLDAKYSSGNTNIGSGASNYAAGNHGHTVSNITGLQATLDSKYSSTNTNIGSGSTNYAAGNHSHNYLPLTGGAMTGSISLALAGYVGYSGTYAYYPYVTGTDTASGVSTRSALISSANMLLHSDIDGSGAVEGTVLAAGGGSPNIVRLASKTTAAGVSNTALTINGNVIYNEGYKPSSSDVGLGNVPNTVHTTGITANTVAVRDSNADLQARLFKSNYQDETGISGAIAFRKSTSDNYIRFCSNPAAIAAWLGVLSTGGGAFSGTITGTSTLSASIVDTTSDAFINTGIANTGSTVGTYFMPLTSQRARHAQGYITHVTTGLVKDGYSSGWGAGTSGFFVGIGGNDQNPTEYFTLAYGGKIKHSSGSEFYSTTFKPDPNDIGALPVSVNQGHFLIGESKWFRAASTGTGFLPNTSGTTGTSYLGTSSWYFNSAYVRNYFGYGFTMYGGGDATFNGTDANSIGNIKSTTGGNLHIDSGKFGASGAAGTLYLNWYSGSGGITFGNGSASQLGKLDSSGNLAINGVYTGSGGTLSGLLTINAGKSIRGYTSSGWSYFELASGSSVAHLALSNTSQEGADANSLHLRPGGTFSGSLILQPGSSMRHKTPTGYIDIGSLNSSHAHFSTDRPSFYFSKNIQGAGGFTVYGTNTRMDSTGVFDNNNRTYSDSNKGNIGTGGTNYAAGDHSHVPHYQTTSTSGVGTKVRLPFTMSQDLMVSFTVRVYQGYEACDVQFSGYLYSATNQWYAPKAVMIAGTANIGIKMGRDSDGYAYVWLTGSNYRGVSVLDVNGGHNNADWTSGWVITQTDTADNVVLSKTLYPNVDTTGAGASGTWGINVTGNSATTSQVYQVYNPASTTYRFLLGNSNNTTGQVFNFSDLYWNDPTSTIVGANISGNATTATVLQTARTIALTGAVTGTATSFNGAANISINATSLNAANLSGTVPNASITGSYTGMANLTGSGTVDFSKFYGNAADSASAPSFSFTSDTNTGMYWVGSDQVGISTGGTASAIFTSSSVTTKRLVAFGTGNDYGSGGVEINGNGSSNTVFPTLGFHQSGRYASSLQLRAGGDFRFYTQGGSSFANVTANQFTGYLNGNALTASYAANSDLLDGNDGTYYDHRRYNAQSYLGAGYISGGSEKPNWFGSGKIQAQMLSASNLGIPGGWHDVLWLSTYTGGDVKRSNALSFGKDTNKMFLTQQNFDATSWGTSYEIWHSGSDGAGSGLDADLLDGLQSTNFGRVDISQSWAGTQTFQNPIYINSSGTTTNIGALNSAWCHFDTTASNGFYFYDNVDVQNLGSRGNITATGDIYANGTRYYGDNKSIVQYSDTWLRFNPDSNFTEGIYCGTSILRTDGQLQVGGSGSAFRALSDGQVYVGSTLHVGTNGNSSYINMNDSDEGTRTIHCNSNRIGFLTQSGSWGSWCDDVGNWNSAGIVTGTDCIATSDIRVKDNLQVIDSPMEKVKQLTGYTFDRKDMGGRRHAGIIAQDLQKVLPEAIFENDDTELGTKLSVSSTAIIGLLVESIKEQQNEIDELKDLVKQLLGGK